VNLPKILKRINATTDGDSSGIKKWYKKRNSKFGFYDGHARFISDKVVEVNGKKITAKKIYLATGASPFVPPIPGIDRTPYWTSSDALRSRKLPKKLIVIGGGYIACELGYAYSALGSEVHWLVRDKALLRREDGQVSQTFTKVFGKREKVHFKTETKKVEFKDGKFTVHIKKGRKKTTMTGDALLVATGVKPNTADLGLENTKIKRNKRGFIEVNKFMETTVKDVYALGDCVGNYMFRHSVNFEGQFLFKSHFIDKKKKQIKYPPMPHAVFTHPEIGGVGMTEEELQKKKIPYIVGFNEYARSAMGEARLSKDEFVKLLFHKKNRKLLGAHILGEEASDMIHQLIYAMTFGATVDDLLEMIYVHPALPEIVRNAARNAEF
jgi:dihydrolipoamide dehydrogenase